MLRLLLSLLLLPTLLTAQERIRLVHTCSYGGEEKAGDYYTFAPSTEANRIVEEICVAYGLDPKRLIVKAANVQNAVATRDGGARVILYSTSFLEKFKADARTKWAAYSVLAHEIGHHLNDHNFDEQNPAKRKMMELEADRYSGSALRMLGATMDEAKAGIKVFALEGETSTHPSGSARSEAVASGWKKQDEHLSKIGVVTPAKRTGPDTKPEPTSAVGMRPGEVAADGLVFVKGGTFSMGCTKEQGKDCYDNESPVRQVTLSDFFIAKYEVTQRQWREVMGDNPSYHKYCDDCPVEQVGWNDIQDFLKKLNAANPDKNYRLPTEAEWEYAARGGSLSKGYKYAGSNKIGEVAWYSSNSGSKPQPVGGKKANELGLHDMSGNVWELCSDWFGTYSFRAEINPKGGGEGDRRVLRGGSWGYGAQDCRVAGRNHDAPTFRYGYLGFRLCRSF